MLTNEEKLEILSQATYSKLSNTFHISIISGVPYVFILGNSIPYRLWVAMVVKQQGHTVYSKQEWYLLNSQLYSFWEELGSIPQSVSFDKTAFSNPNNTSITPFLHVKTLMSNISYEYDSIVDIDTETRDLYGKSLLIAYPDHIYEVEYDKYLKEKENQND